MRRLGEVGAAILAAGLIAVIPGPAVMGQATSPSPAASDGPVGAGGRFVLPEGGYAITFPEGWTIHVHPLEHSAIPVVRAEEPDSSARPEARAFCEVKVFGPCSGEAEGACSTMVDEWAAREVAWWESGTEVEVPSAIASAALALPVGHAVRVDVEYADIPWSRSYYVLTDGQMAATLNCIAPRPLGDRWLSIAESFESLPTEE